MSGRSARLLRNALMGVYFAIPPALVLGTYEEWLFQSSTRGTGFAAGATMVLIAITVLAEYAEVFKPTRAGREVWKSAAYFAGALAWAVAAGSVVGENRVGTAVLIGPLAALMLGFMFHLCRLLGMHTRAFSAALLTSTTVPVATQTSSLPASLEAGQSGGEVGAVGRVDIAANTWMTSFRLLAGIAAFLIVAQLLRHTAFGGPAVVIFYLGAIAFAVLAVRSFTSRGPALALDSEGISIRRDFSNIRRLSWPQVIGFEMKSAAAYTYLVIYVKDANEMISQRGAVTRWLMGRSLALFGSPVRIPLVSLKCDRRWLWQKVNERLVIARGERPK